MSNSLTQTELKEILHYNKFTGIFTWAINISSRARKGAIAGNMNQRGYCRIKIKNKEYLSHRLAFLYIEGYLPENGVDHRNRVKDDNRWSNLRETTQTCNMRNKGKLLSNKSGITGVHRDPRYNTWVVSIGVDSKTVYIGSYSNLIDAAKARWEAEVKYGFPDCNTTSSAYNYLKC